MCPSSCNRHCAERSVIQLYLSHRAFTHIRNVGPGHRPAGKLPFAPIPADLSQHVAQFISHGEKTMEMIGRSMVPGAFLADLLPVCAYIARLNAFEP